MAPSWRKNPPTPSASRSPFTFTCMTYNVRCCTVGGTGGTVERVARVIAPWGPDVVALQEVDVARRRTARLDQARELAQALGMQSHFQPAISGEDGEYGIALLSRLEMRIVRAELLPLLPDRPAYEPRGAVWAAIEAGGREVQVIATHLGLTRRERRLQVDTLLGSRWLGHQDCRPPRVLLGDFNFLPYSREYSRVAATLKDALGSSRGPWWRATYPAALPLVRLDHVFVSDDVRVTRAMVGRGRELRGASDHLPVIAELELPATSLREGP